MLGMGYRRLPHGLKVHMTSLVERRARLVGGPGALEECRLLGVVRRPARPGLPHPDGRRLCHSRSGLYGIEVLWLCRRCRRCCRRSGCRRSGRRRDDHRRTGCWRTGFRGGWTLQGCRQLALWCGGGCGGGGRGRGGVVASGPIRGGGLLLFEERGQRCLHIVARQRTCAQLLYLRRRASREKFGVAAKSADTRAAALGSGNTSDLRSLSRYYKQGFMVAVTCLELSRIRHHSSSTQTLDAAWANSRCGAALICVLPFREAPAPPARTGAPRGRANIRNQLRKNQRRSPFPQ